MCATGGAHAWNNFHHTFVGATVFDKDAERHLIGTDWGSTVVDGAVSSQLGFQAGSPPISVSGSVNVQDQDVHGGNVGGHERMDLDIDPDWNANRVTGYYIAPENFIWDRAADWQGNTVQGLWEYPMSASSWGVYSGGYGVRYHCSSALPSAECALGY